MSSKIAIIDVGTNTINLLIVDKTRSNFEILHKARKGIGLGHGSFKETMITPQAFERGVKCLKAYADVCKSFKTRKVLAFGTSTLRHALNASHFISEVRRHSNIDIKVINGDTEAELIYNGIKLLYDFDQTSLVMDIGGGSTEFILADKMGIINKASFEIGVSRINQTFNFLDPYNIWDIYKINNYLNDIIGNKLSTFKTNTLIGSSGSFKTFYALWSLNKAPLKSFIEIEFSGFMKILDDVIHSSLEERKSNPLIDNLRIEMLPISAIKTKWVIDQTGVEKILISPYSLKEGVIFSN
jgi:exopolyphosphatase/guanosine-5'-triphosphate,3'-diphosphate pyrophosphatase